MATGGGVVVEVVAGGGAAVVDGDAKDVEGGIIVDEVDVLGGSVDVVVGSGVRVASQAQMEEPALRAEIAPP